MTNPQPVKARSADLSPAAQAAEAWVRQLARMLKVSRLYKRDNPIVVNATEQTIKGLRSFLDRHGLVSLRFTATEVWLGEECLVKADRAIDQEGEQLGSLVFLRQLPIMFYSDGVRRVTIQPAVSRGEMEVFLEALLLWCGGSKSNDDLVTLLWQANLNLIAVDAVPLEQIIRLSTDEAGPKRVASGTRAEYNYVGDELHADIGQAAGFQGLHRDTFDDWEAPESTSSVAEVYPRLLPAMESAVERFHSMWEDERQTDWRAMAPDVLRLLLELDPGDETRAAVAHAVATWVGDSLEHFSWEEARHALDLLLEFDPGLAHSETELGEATTQLDIRGLVERLDEAEPDEAGRFAAVTAALGPGAVGLGCAVLGRTTNPRTRAAAATALSYICADEPVLLAPFVADPRPSLVQGVAFVLGQIGGPEVAGPLSLAAQHPDTRVRREVVQALGAVPLDDRLPVLLGQLDTDDSQLLGKVLGMLTREKDPRISRALVEIVTSPTFATRSEIACGSIYAALGEVGGDEAVPALGAQLMKGGWFARRSFERSAAARALERIGTPKALDVLESGLRSHNRAVRSACLDAMSQKDTR